MQPRTRRCSFIWRELSQFVIIDVESTFFTGNHCFVRGKYSGSLPSTCVPGTGHYVSTYPDREDYVLYFRYFEILRHDLHDTGYVVAKFWIDSSRTRDHYAFCA